MDATGENLFRRFDGLVQARTEWNAHCEEIAERVWPDWSGHFNQQYQGVMNQQRGGKKTSEMFDATASLASDRFSAIMESMLTPRSSRWHWLRASDESLMRKRRVAIWFEDKTNLLFKLRYATRANFASQQHDVWRSIGVFGNGILFTDERAGGGFRYKALHPGGAYFDTNHQGIVDTMFRPITYTARKAYQKWGDKLPAEIIEKANGAGSKPETEYLFLHVVQPRDEVDPNRIDFRGMDFASYYVAEKEKHVIEESGYRVFPYSVSRYATAPEDVNGRSPAMLALAAIKVLNEEKKTVIKQGHRVVDPVLLAHDDGLVDTFSLRPGTMNAGAMTVDGKRLVDVLPTGNIAIGKELMDDERMMINDAFLVTLFQILVETPQMTATEVLERAREKGALISPTMGRQESESLGPTITREVDLMTAQGYMNDMPPELIEAKGEYEIEYDSPLSRSQKAEEMVGLYRSLEFAERHSAATQDLSTYDWINVDEAMPEIMRGNAVPERFKRTKKAVLAIREQRTQAQQMQTAIEAAPAVAGLAKSGMVDG